MVGKFLRREISRLWLVAAFLLVSTSVSTWHFYTLAQKNNARADLNLYAAVLINQELLACQAKTNGLSL